MRAELHPRGSPGGRGAEPVVRPGRPRRRGGVVAAGRPRGRRRQTTTGRRTREGTRGPCRVRTETSRPSGVSSRLPCPDRVWPVSFMLYRRQGNPLCCDGQLQAQSNDWCLHPAATRQHPGNRPRHDRPGTAIKQRMSCAAPEIPAIKTTSRAGCLPAPCRSGLAARIPAGQRRLAPHGLSSQPLISTSSEAAF